jgi:hypothetical protein
MSLRSPLAASLLAASLVLLAGCSLAPGGTPTGSPQPPPDVEVSFTNAAHGTYDAEVLLLPRPADRARVTFVNGSTTEIGNLSDVQGVGLYGPPVDGAALRDAEPLGIEPLDQRIYRGIGSRSSVSSTFDSPPRNASLFVVVTGTDGVYLWATATCSGNDSLNAFDVEIHEVGPGLSVGCESFRASSGASERG